ncbi:acyltransferase family protein [Vibrio cyclitrophicus]|uniref:acyltransferase family protein n=1 Tax=Vibrio cyclitrophicus TaxID=47951 RepID=UPI000C83EF0F|nr:acyltransferase [Vibrio cyclitrophicus]PME51328.1 hypothetical protein BCV35_06190 [Vibrio cyclitrophicus]
MFGTYRTILALAVVLQHLISIPMLGHYAVHGFFILSGYLMTYVMCNTYGYSVQGVKSFAVNRFLRLYPSYWGILAISMLAIAWFGESNSMEYREFIYIPDTFSQWLQNLSLIFPNIFPGQISPRISPPTWALTIELIFYFFIAIGISKSKRATVTWFCISLLYMTITHVYGMEYNYRYNIIFAGTLPFSLGAMIYHFYGNLRNQRLIDSSGKVIPILFTILVLNSFISAVLYKLEISEFAFNVSFYLNYVLNASVIFMLIEGKVPILSRKLDKKIGDYSYPIYLMHWQAGFAASMLLWGEPIRGFNVQGFTSLLFALVICLFLSTLIIRLIDHPIEKLRQKVKFAQREKSLNAVSNN